MKSKRKPVEIVGVVDPRGIGGDKSGRQKLWKFSFRFKSWRGPDGGIEKRPLLVEQKNISERKLDRMMKAVRPNDNLRVRVRLAGDRAELVKVLGEEKADKDLKARAEELQKPPKPWKHKDLGTFTYDDLSWVKEFSLPALKVFKYRSRGRGAGRPKIKIQFMTDGEGRLPTTREATVAKKVIKNLDALVNRLKKSLFDDLNGRGPQSGMWWHGDLQAINGFIKDEGGGRKFRPLKIPADLEGVLGEPAIWIQESVYGYDKPCAVICFEALFEPEHGIGILTDGIRILGTGFSMDASPFE